MTQATTHDVVVIGAGVAGLAATREALRAGLSAAYLEAQMFGGLILNVNELQGGVQGSGSDYASELVTEVADLGGECLDGTARGLEADAGGFVLTSDAGSHRARAVIVASGAALKHLGVPGEAEFEARGVSHCADCDGPMFDGQTVVVVGGGDSALQSAASLAQYCARVHVVQRGGALSGKAELVAAVQAHPQIEVHLDSEIAEIVGGDAGVEGVRVNGALLACSGVFAYIGLDPVAGYLPPQIARDERGAIVTSPSLETALPGVFAAGAVRAGCGGMVEDAMADGIAAARAAAKHIGAPAGRAA